MEYYKGYACVTVEELTSQEGGNAIMSIHNYRQLSLRKRFKIVRAGKGKDNYALINFYSLPERFREAVIAKYGNPEEVIKAQSQTDRVLEDSKARDFFSTHIMENGEGLSDIHIDEYTMNASVLNEIIKISNETKSRQKALGGKGGISPKELILATVKELKLYPGHTLPESWVRISQKIREYKAEGYKVLIKGYVGNKNSIKMTDEMGRQAVALKRSKVPQYNDEQIFAELNQLACIKGWKPLKSINTLKAYLSRPDVMPLWFDAKYGSKAAKQKFDRKHRTQLPSVRDALWYGDGTKLNLYYKAFDANGKLKVCTTQVYEVMDAYSEVLLGYAISDVENFEAQYLAYRNAVEFAGCRPYEIVNDNQGGHRKEEARVFFDKIARVARRTAPDNGSSKTIESLFGRFQHQYLSRDWRFTGMNITAKKESSHPDLEFVMANKANLYTLEELKAAYLEYRNAWNLGLHPATGKPRMDMYMESINAETQPTTKSDVINMFWEQTKQPSTFTTSGITITIDKKEYTYEVYDKDGMPDLDFRNKNTYRQFFVKYDPLNMTVVRLYIEDSMGGLKFVAEASPYTVIHRALQEQKEGEMSFIRQMDEKSKQNRVDNFLEMVQLENEFGIAPEQHGLNRAKVCGITAKSLERFMDKSLVTGKEQPVSVGQVNKQISNTTYDQIAVSGYDKL